MRSEAGIVDQHADLQAQLVRSLPQLGGGGRHREVHRDHGDGDAVRLAQLCGQLVEPVSTASHHNEIVAAGGELPGELRADPG